jgi:hypothetical protein
LRLVGPERDEHDDRRGANPCHATIQLLLRRDPLNHGMTPASLVDDDWNHAIGRLGGAEALASSARTTKAFAWGRKVPDAVTLLRLVLAYCLGQWGLRSTAAWAAAVGFADISTVRGAPGARALGWNRRAMDLAPPSS